LDFWRKDVLFILASAGDFWMNGLLCQYSLHVLMAAGKSRKFRVRFGETCHCSIPFDSSLLRKQEFIAHLWHVLIKIKVLPPPLVQVLCFVCVAGEKAAAIEAVVGQSYASGYWITGFTSYLKVPL